MAYREVDVLEVKEVLRRWLAGAPKKAIARELGLSAGTVRRYVAWATETGLVPEDAPPATDCGPLLEGLVTAVAGRRSSEAGRPRGESWAACLAQKTEIERLLKTEHVGRSLKLTKIRKLLKRRLGLDVPYSTLHRFASAELGFGKASPTVPVADGEPGKELQVDSGWVGEYEPDGDGKRRRFRALIFSPSVSRYRFVYPLVRETTEEVIAACEAAWSFYGGVFEVLVPDNTKAIVERADPLDPKITRAFLEYSQARGFYVDPTRARKPKDKPRVERAVRHVREDCFAGERLRDVEQAREHALRWCRDDCGRRRHGTTGRLPHEHFETVERSHLKPAPDEPYDLPTWSRPRVQRDQHAQVGLALYSVPAAYVGAHLDARLDSQTVRFYVRGTIVKAHPRVGPRERSTDSSDFDPARFATAQRDVAYFLDQAREAGEWIGKYAAALLDSELPWTRMRHVHALLRLPQRYGLKRVEDCCRTALEVDLVNVVRLERLIKLGGAAPEPGRKPRGEVIPFGKHQRPASDFALPGGLSRAVNKPTIEQEGNA